MILYRHTPKRVTKHQDGGTVAPTYLDSDVYKNATDTQKLYLHYKHNGKPYFFNEGSQQYEPIETNAGAGDSGETGGDYVKRDFTDTKQQRVVVATFKDPETGKMVRVPRSVLNPGSALGNKDLEMENTPAPTKERRGLLNRHQKGGTISVAGKKGASKLSNSYPKRES